MRRLLFVLLIPFVFSCYQKEVERLTVQNDSLFQATEEKAQALESFIDAFNKVQDNLDEIKVKEGIITMRAKSEDDIAPDSLEQINEDIIDIYKLLLRNKHTLATVSNKLKAANIKIAGVDKTIDKLNKQIEEKDIQITKLKEELAAKNIDIEKLNEQIKNLSASVNELKVEVDTLSRKNREKTAVIEEKTATLNTAYYIIGKKKDLVKGNIIEKKGLGGAYKLKRSFNKGKFTQVDITQTDYIEINQKKVEIITSHPDAAYKLEGSKKMTEGIRIVKTNEFWGASKYLVILTK